MSAPDKHALLSASSAERWIHCPPSARLEAGFPNTSTKYTDEGTLAHALADLNVQLIFTGISKQRFNEEYGRLAKSEYYNKKMEEYVSDYMDYINLCAMKFTADPTVYPESRVSFSDYAPDGFGTCDCIMVYGDALQIIDFKYGAGVPVSAENNPQMMLYALGALDRDDFRLFRTPLIKTVRMSIFQPRISNTSEWEMPVSALREWGDKTVRPSAAKAHKGEGAYCSGEWCRFCRAKAVCRTRANVNTALEDFALAVPPILTDAEIGDVLTKAQQLKAWVSDLEEYALKATLEGKTISGWKAVEGRSNRVITDQDAAFGAVIAAGYAKEMLYDYVPKTLTAVEKLLGKKASETILTPYISKPRGKPTLVPESDKREPYNAAVNDFEGVM